MYFSTFQVLNVFSSTHVFIPTSTWYGILYTNTELNNKIAQDPNTDNMFNQYIFQKEIPEYFLEMLPSITVSFLILSIVLIIINRCILKRDLTKKEHIKTLLISLYVSFFIGDTVLALPIIGIISILVFIYTQHFKTIIHNILKIYTISLSIILLMGMIGIKYPKILDILN
ncbi:hypothetical protein [Campylobacter fetus]|uniref:hypothetical protein n=1 Tax=Campylobacter fetus TaxID=196 RepID=UPI000FCB76E6|nr:hypothetical protein [Campylobacter fetus]RUT51002.1 hypothetical protein BWK67_00315 [Campylobacter fetus]RUT51730.1 hypothetical protein BWK51_00315 [Campylobacter fetus]